MNQNKIRTWIRKTAGSAGGCLLAGLLCFIPAKAAGRSPDVIIAQENRAGSETVYESPGGKTEEGLRLEKTVTPLEGDEFTVSLGAWVTGTEKKKGKPADIVLVMDCSGSMEKPYTGSPSRMAALKQAASSFLERISGINEGMKKDDRSRIALVRFSDQNQSQALQGLTAVDAQTLPGLEEKVNSLYGNGHTRTDVGLDLAQKAFDKTSEDRKKAVILFTDGQPNDQDGFQPSVANRALEYAQSLKEKGTEIFVICIEPHAKVGQGELLPGYKKSPEDTKENTAWYYHSISTLWEGEPESDANTSDKNMAALTDRFMHLVSSNNPHARSMDVPDAQDPSDAGSTEADGFSYYSTALDTSALEEIFSGLAYRVGASDAYLGGNAQLRDYVTDSFAVAEGSIRAYVQDRVKRADGSFAWGEKRPADSCTAAQDGNTVTLSGFDYESCYVSEGGHVDRSDYYGSRVCLEFRIRRGSTYGGNHIPTNSPKSGIYRDSSMENPAGFFPVPFVDLPIRYTISSRNFAVYTPDSVDLSAMLSYVPDCVPDGKSNAGVDIMYTMKDEEGSNIWAMFIPAGKKASEVSWDWNHPKAVKCQTYSFHCTITPKTEGTYPEAEGDIEATAHVYYPILTLQDTTQVQGETADVLPGNTTGVKGLRDHFVSLSWQCADGCPSKEENEPEIGYYTGPLSGTENQDGKYVIATRDAAMFTVRIYRIKEGKFTDDITDAAEFVHRCGRKDCSFESLSAADPSVRFLIHGDGTGRPGGKEGSGDDAGSGGTSGGHAGSDTGEEGKGSADGSHNTDGSNTGGSGDDQKGSGGGTSGDGAGSGAGKGGSQNTDGGSGSSIGGSGSQSSSGSSGNSSSGSKGPESGNKTEASGAAGTKALQDAYAAGVNDATALLLGGSGSGTGTAEAGIGTGGSGAGSGLGSSSGSTSGSGSDSIHSRSSGMITDLPTTGDNDSVLFFGLSVLASAAVLFCILYRIKKNYNR